MSSPLRKIRHETLDWRGILIAVRYEEEWLGGDFTAHLELETLEPARAPLPVTETGYRSHFIGRDLIEEAGGPVGYAEAWLNQASTSKGWIEEEAAARQFSLF